MGGKGQWVDNIFVERFWRSVKYEDVYLSAYDTVLDIVKYFTRHNIKRLHQGINGMTPDMLYYELAAKNAA